MRISDIFFTYKSILYNNFLKKKYFTVIRKIFGIFFKLLVFEIKKVFFENYINLDKVKKINEKYFLLSLDDLFKIFNSDKGSILKEKNGYAISHNYSVFYEKYLNNIKSKNINIIEIGSQEGRAVASFYFYFPNSKIIAADINPFRTRFQSNRIRPIYLDVSSKETLEFLSNHFNFKFDIIIDDASHNVRDILITLAVFFKKLNPGGYYIIEDIDQQKVSKNLNPDKESPTALELLKKLSENKTTTSKYLSREEIEFLRENIKEYYFEKGKFVYFGQNISDIVFLKK